jgi:hypothetical protein
MRALLLALALLAAVPAASGAATVVTDPGGFLYVKGSPQADDLTISPDGDQSVLFTDPAGVEGCEPVDATTMRCGASRCCKYLNISLEEGDDRLRIADGMNLDVVAHGGDGDDTLLGGQFRDRLQGGPGNDVLSGGDGMDRLDGWTGNDEMDGGLGRDDLFGGEGRDRVSYADRTEGVRVWLDGRATGAFNAEDRVDAEWIDGGAGPDVIIGSPARNTIVGNGGDDRLSGGQGEDFIDGGDGDDLLLGDGTDVEAPRTQPVGEGAIDLLRGGAGNDSLRGDAGRDLLDGEAGDDLVDARDAKPTWEVRDETAGCGDGHDRALLDYNDEPVGCEETQVGENPRPPALPPSTYVPPPVVQGPGPRPEMGVPALLAGVVHVPVHCDGRPVCSFSVRVREARGRRRVLAAGRASITSGEATAVLAPLKSAARARVRRVRRLHAVVELRRGSRRWVRPLTLRREAASRR